MYNTLLFVVFIKPSNCKKQIINMTFVQGTISTVGDRMKEIILPIKKEESEKITTVIRDIIKEKEILRKKIINLIKNNKF